jgi:hypothetical protein
MHTRGLMTFLTAAVMGYLSPSWMWEGYEVGLCIFFTSWLHMGRTAFLVIGGRLGHRYGEKPSLLLFTTA